MDITDITQVISTLGFPIVTAIALFWFLNKERENHNEEIKSLQESINKNTTVLSELKELITYLVGELKKWNFGE